MPALLGTRLVDAEALLHLAPPVIHMHDPLPAIIRSLASDPAARAAFVVDDQNRLVGMVSQEDVDRDMLGLVAADNLEGLGPRSLNRLAHGLAETARGLMRDAAAVHADASIADALRCMRDHDMECAAVVDGAGRLLGYVAMFEVLAGCLEAG